MDSLPTQLSGKIFIGLFFSLLLSFKIYLHTPDTSSLSDVQFANIFFQFVVYLFILLTISFKEHEFLILLKLNLSVFKIFFINHALCVKSKKKTWLNTMSQWFSPMFPSRSFIVLGFTVRSMIYFELVLHIMQETWVQFLDQKDPLEKGMATHSSILAWRISWTREPGGLQSMGWHRFRQN